MSTTSLGRACRAQTGPFQHQDRIPLLQSGANTSAAPAYFELTLNVIGTFLIGTRSIDQVCARSPYTLHD
jgi:hypothetical protein